MTAWRVCSGIVVTSVSVGAGCHAGGESEPDSDSATPTTGVYRFRSLLALAILLYGVGLMAGWQCSRGWQLVLTDVVVSDDDRSSSGSGLEGSSVVWGDEVSLAYGDGGKYALLTVVELDGEIRTIGFTGPEVER